MPRGNVYTGPRTYFYRIQIDKYNWTLQQTYAKAENRKEAFADEEFDLDEANWSTVGYYSTLSSLITAGFEKALRMEMQYETLDQTSLQDLHDHLRETAGTLKLALENLHAAFLNGEFTKEDDSFVEKQVWEALDRHRERLKTM